MSKRGKIRGVKNPPPPRKPKPLFGLRKESRWYWMLAAAACLLYVNTLSNQFALDDGLVLRDNKIVLKGISGIPDILTHDSFYGAIGDSKNLSGGRYRPLSLISYAIEISFFGVNPFIHHLLNVLFYALTSVVLLRFLARFIFPGSEWASVVAALLFTIHPLHTEVVANIKSRDEIFSLLFLLITLHYLLKFLIESGRGTHLGLSALFYFLALLSKENGLIFIVLIPLTIFTFSQHKLQSILKYSAIFLLVAGMYFFLRIYMIGLRSNDVPGVMDNPYVLASAEQKYATILFVFLSYLKLLFYPHPLTFDYSYQHIPYRTFSDPPVLLSLVIYACIGIYAFIRLGKKDIISWCIIFYFGTIAIVSNIFFNVGAPMAERFLYQATVPFAIAVAELISRIEAALPNMRSQLRSAGYAILGIATVWCAFMTITRNKDWKSDESLFLHDVQISANSARANTFAGIALVRLADAEKDTALKRQKATESLAYFRKSLQIKDDYIPTLLNMGVAYSRIDSGEAAEQLWLRAKEMEPDNPNFINYDSYLAQYYYRSGMKAGAQHDFEKAVSDLEKAVTYAPSNANMWYNLGGAYFTQKQYDKARESWERSLALNPNLKQAQQGLLALPSSGQNQ